MKAIVIKSGPQGGTAFELKTHLLIGRARLCDVRISSENASRRHALIMLRADGAAILRDLGSRNGTTVNGRAIHYHVLEPAGRFEVGDVEFEYSVSGDEAVGGEGETVATAAAEKTTEDQELQAGLWKPLLRLAQRLRGRG